MLSRVVNLEAMKSPQRVIRAGSTDSVTSQIRAGMGKRIPKPTSAHRREWEDAISHSKYDDIDPEHITDAARVDDDSDSATELTAQDIRRRRHARKHADDEDDLVERVDRKQLERMRDGVSDESSISSDSESDEQSDANNDNEISDSDGSQDESMSSDDNDGDGSDSPLMHAVPVLSSGEDPVKTLAELERQDSTFLLESSRSKEQDASRAAAVRHQRKLYETALDLRMSLQRPLQIAGRFPYGDGYDAVCSQSVEIVDTFRAAADILSDTLAELTCLESRLLNASGTFGAIEPNMISKKKRGRPDLDAIWQEIDARFDATRSGRESAIDYWNRRTQVAGGGHSLSSKKFKALNRGVLAQIRTGLADIEPLRQRAFANRNQLAVLGSLQAAEVFDDTDFYHMLLKDLISSSAGETTATAGRVSRRRTVADPAGKNVDRRASKGRKIRFEVHEKIVNFMAPCTNEIAADFDVDHLFTHLFAT